MPEAIIIDTPAGIRYAQMAAAKGAIKLEKLGMKRRGGSLRKGWAIRLGMPPNSSHDAVISVLREEMDKALAAR